MCNCFRPKSAAVQQTSLREDSDVHLLGFRLKLDNDIFQNHPLLNTILQIQKKSMSSKLKISLKIYTHMRREHTRGTSLILQHILPLQP